MEKITNKAMVTKAIEKLDFELGCYSKLIDKLSKIEIEKVIEELNLEYTDVVVTMNKIRYVVEIKTVDNEKDLHILPVSEYNELYFDKK